MTTYSPFELEPIFIDFKNESYNLGLDIQANQNDTLTLNFICRNNGIEEDMTKYKVELRVHNNNAKVDYIQTQNENVTLSADGSVKIVCQSLKGNKLTAYSGQCNGVLRIFNTENKQKATRIITMRIVADPLETGKANICESTITKLEDLDWILNEAYNIEDEFKKAIEEAIKQKAELVAKISESVTAKNNLNSTIQTANNTNNTLTDTNNNAVNTKNELNTLNNNAINTKSNLDKSNSGALVTNKTLSDTNTGANNTNNALKLTISEADKSKTALDASKINADKSKSALDTSKSNADKSKVDIDGSIATGNTLKNDIDNRLITGNKLKTDMDNSSAVATTKQEQLGSANVQAEKNIETLNSFGDASKLTKDVTTLKTKVLENTLTSITTDSTLTKLPNSENSFVRNMQIRGKTLQNLVPKTVGEKTIITDGGQWQFFNIPKENILFKENTIYTFVVDIEEMSVENQFSLVLSENIDSDKGKIQTTVTAKNIGRNIIKANSYADFNSSTIKYDLRCYIYNPNKIKGSTVKFKFMILEGEVKEIPSYFEGIKSVGEAEDNKISILSRNSNFCSMNKLRFYKAENTGREFELDKIPKGNYNLSYNGTDKGNLKLYYITKDWQKHYPNPNGDFTIEDNEYERIYIYIDQRIYDDNTLREYTNIKINRLDKIVSYEPCKSDKTEILLPSPHMGLPDGTSDIVYFDKNERIKNVGKKVFYGATDENWTWSSNQPISNSLIRLLYVFNTSKIASSYISNKFVFNGVINIGTKFENEGLYSHFSDTQINVIIDKSRLETPDTNGFKKLLKSWSDAGVPLEFYYQLATPVVEKLNIKDTLQTFQDGYIMLDNAITPTTQLEYSTNIPSAIGGVTKITDKLVDDVTNVEITISDLDAELDESRKGKTTLNERLEDDKKEINLQLKDYAKKDGTLQTGLNAEMLAGLKVKDFQKVYGGDINDFNTTLTQGEYSFNNGALHQPNNYKNYGKLIVLVSDGGTHNNLNNWIWQIMYPTESSLGIWYRNKYNDSSWSKWKQLATVDDTGWIDLTPLNNVRRYVDNKLQIRRIDNIVYLKAIVTNITSEVIAFSLPNGFRPSHPHRYIGQKNGWNPIGVGIEADGNITIGGVSFADHYACIDTTFYID
ncbi:hypothetical protein DWV12_14765 [Clostridium botulinum]|uniref:pyocin knob domain-containing protein n=1 Tax=Clostridium botulinum TaxID=1491 RepID=UPI00217E8894|nr:pyocin knob domain-containing protein [Clostridium botulinum]MCS6103568.1 hypothetical protein [Clostridium botulinum]MCS6108605.1 hypothetical protein [Clostridium botulinum]